MKKICKNCGKLFETKDVLKRFESGLLPNMIKDWVPKFCDKCATDRLLRFVYNKEMEDKK